MSVPYTWVSRGSSFIIRSVRQYKNKLNDWGVFKNKCKASRMKGRQETQSNFAKREEIHRVTEKKARRRVEGKGVTSIPPNQRTALNMIAPEAYWMPTRESQGRLRCSALVCMPTADVVQTLSIK